MNGTFADSTKGPPINDVGPLFRFYDPPPSPFVVFLLSKFRHSLRRRCLWMVPKDRVRFQFVKKSKRFVILSAD